MTTKAAPDAKSIASGFLGGSDWCQCPLHTMFPQRISELVEPTFDDLKAACAMIGNDSYGKPCWTPETIHPHNSVVQAFARHARLAVRAILTKDATNA